MISSQPVPHISHARPRVSITSTVSDCKDAVREDFEDVHSSESCTSVSRPRPLSRLESVIPRRFGSCLERFEQRHFLPTPSASGTGRSFCRTRRVCPNVFVPIPQRCHKTGFTYPFGRKLNSGGSLLLFPSLPHTRTPPGCCRCRCTSTSHDFYPLLTAFPAWP